MKRRTRYSEPDYAPSKPYNKPAGFFAKLNYTYAVIIAAVFILGMGVGVVFSSGTTFTPENVVSREVIDRAAPNPEICIQYGASAIVTDMRVFVTLNPFNVYVTQPVMQPGCVIRRSNWAILQKQNLVDSTQVNECKNRMNTFGYTGKLESTPQINCIYQNNAAGNLFINPPGSTAPISETRKF